jgi:branched-chain amino acid transport system permease protein
MSDGVTIPTTIASPHAAPFLRREWLPILLFGALLLAPFVASLFGSERFIASLLSRVMILAIAAMSLDLILGVGALVSFGHAAFLGLGGYACAILMSHGVGEAIVALPVALAVCALFALATGAVSLRTEGLNFIMITLAFAQMAYFTMVSLSQYGGDDGIQLARRSTVAGAAVLENARAFYVAIWLVLVGAYWLCRRIVGSRFGRVLAAARENPVRVAALGFPVYRVRLVAYVIAGMLCGIAGFLFANHNAFMSPAFMSWQRSGELLVMVILGGLGSLHGAVLGAAAFLLLEEWLSRIFSENWKAVFGPLLILVVLLGRGGLIGLVGGLRRG